MTAKRTYALLIYRSGEREPAEEDVERAMQGHRKLQREASARGDLHAVARLGDVAGARTVALRGNAHDVTDGCYIDTKEWLVGFYLLDCESDKEALSRARILCPIPDHVIEVRPVTWRWKP
jgi:hypothetical protein